MATPTETDLARACRLADELIEICHAMGKPLAGDFIHEGVDLLIKGTGYVRLGDTKDLTKDRFREN